MVRVLFYGPEYRNLVEDILKHHDIPYDIHLLVGQNENEEYLQQLRNEGFTKIVRYNPTEGLQSFHIAFLHKSEKYPSCEDVVTRLKHDAPNCITIIFTGDESHSRLEGDALYLKVDLLEEKLSEILSYCDEIVDQGREIKLECLYEHIFQVPWCYEYFLELSLRLLSLTNENKEKIKNIIEKRKTEWNLTGEEFGDLKEKVQTFIKKNDDVNILDEDYSKEDYKVIYNELKRLSYPERKKFLGEV